jgi:hypothetical protein
MKINKREKIVNLPLSEAGKKTVLTRVSSDNYYNWMLSILMPFDLLFTYFFRYGRVAYNDMINAEHPHSTNDNGPMIDYTVQHHGVAAAVTLGFISIAALSASWEINRQLKIKNSTSAKYIYDQLNNVMEDHKHIKRNEDPEESAFPDGIAEEKSESFAAETEFEYELNQTVDVKKYIAQFFQADEHLQKKYDRLEIEDDNLRLVLKTGAPKPKHHPPRVIDRYTGIDETVEEEIPDELAENPRPVAEDKPGFFKKVNQFVINKIIYPIWQSTVLMSFVYWIEWIAGGIFTGDFNPWGVAGLPNALAFGLPVLAGLTYPVIKIYNYYNNKPVENLNEPSLDEKEAAEKDMSTLLRRALALREYVINKSILLRNIKTEEKKLPPHGYRNGYANTNGHTSSPQIRNRLLTNQMDLEIKQLRDARHKWLKPAVMFFSVATGSYVGAQYCTWIITGLANLLFGESVKIAILSSAGIPLLAGAALFGCYKAYEAYQNVMNHNKTVDDTSHHEEICDLEQKLADHRLKTGGKSCELYYKKTPPVNYLETQFFADPKRHGPSKWTTANKIGARAFQFINGGCTGIFLARVFFVEGSAISLPFAAMAFSYPVTIAILATIGTLYGAFKVYEYHQQRKDAHARNLIATRTERLECLRREVELLELSDQLSDLKAQVEKMPKHTSKSHSVSMDGLMKRRNGHTNGNGNGTSSVVSISLESITEGETLGGRSLSASA